MIREFINYHFKENKNKYLFFLFVFTLGIIIGGITIYFLSSEQIDELVNYINSFFSSLTKDTSSINSKEIFSRTLFRDFKIYFFLWVLGLGVLSIIYSSGIIFYSGFLLGFTNTFFIYKFGIKGLVFSFIVIILQSIIKTFALLFSAVTSSCFKSSIQKNNKHKYKKTNNSPFYIRYTIYIILAFLVNLIGVYIESYVVPMFIVLFSSSFL